MGCCRPDGCCGGFIGLLTLISAVFTLGFPWYFAATKMDNAEGGSCTKLTLQSWMDTYSYCHSCNHSACPDVYHWQSDCQSMDYDCTGAKTTWNVSLALTVIATFCSLFVCIGFFIRCCSSQGQRSYLHVIMNLVTFTAMLTALIYFAIAWPKHNCNPTLGTCQAFWGSQTGGPIEVAWGPAGWIAGCLCCLFTSISLCMSCRRSADEESRGSYYSMDTHHDDYHHQQQQQQPHTQTTGVYAAKSTYL